MSKIELLCKLFLWLLTGKEIKNLINHAQSFTSTYLNPTLNPIAWNGPLKYSTLHKHHGSFRLSVHFY